MMMKNFLLFTGLLVAIGLPVKAHADTRLLVEYDGDTHTAVKVFSVPTKGVVRETISKKPNYLESDRLELPENHILVSWDSKAGPSSALLNDPRIIRAPMMRDGIGHEAIIIQDKGIYLLTINSDDIQLDTLKINFPGTQVSTKLSMPSGLD